MYVVNLIFDIPLRHHYSYLSNEHLEIGQRVSAKLRNKEQIAFVTAIVEASQFHDYPLDKLQHLSQIYLEIIPKDIISLCNFAATYYHHSLGSTLFCAIPALLRKINSRTDITLPQNKHYQLTETGKTYKPRGKKQINLWHQLSLSSLSWQQIKEMLGVKPDKLINDWLMNGVISELGSRLSTNIITNITANEEQLKIINTLSNHLDEFYPALLYGITGSGKTEVFLQLIHKVLIKQKQVLALIPEINLTPQLAARFQARFPSAKISVLNSEVSEKERYINWLRAKNGETDIILGTRLSIFTPFARLGLIIVDEEHDASFKQNDSLRYHARDLAIYRAKTLDIPIIMASATPSLESLYNYKLGKFHLYKLTKRAVSNAILPEINIVNLAHYPVNQAGISDPALDALAKCLARKELALVFINRRGYAPILSCYDCGWVSQCKNCSSRMVYHNNSNNLKCHHCGYQTRVPSACPKCHNQYLHTIGHGTQKLEEFLAHQFPNAKIRRIDRDTTNRKDDWQELYQEINQHKIDILVGTQMLAKGHDFPNLTLVVGINIDNALFSYDFRASEDMFNILTQVTGRAGRAAKSGQVILQTNYSDHPIYQFLQKHDFEGFINYTLQERKQNQLPPFTYQALIKLSSTSEKQLIRGMHELSLIHKKLNSKNIIVFPPVPAVMYKLHNRYRGQMLISSKSREYLHSYLNQLEPFLAEINYLTVAIDIDPLEV